MPMIQTMNKRTPPSPQSQSVPAPLIEAARHSQPHPAQRKGAVWKLSRIPRLLMLGYATDERQRRHERQGDWQQLYAILMFKIENITVVSGLLLASSCNLLIAGELRRMTHAAVSASMFGSILSIIFGLLCRIHITSRRLELLTKQTHLFYYLYATPSLYGGGAALAFFVAVCAFTWLEESTAGYGWEGRVAAVILSGVLIGNAAICFVLGAVVPPESVAIEGVMVGEHGHDGIEGRQTGGAGSGTGPQWEST